MVLGDSKLKATGMPISRGYRSSKTNTPETIRNLYTPFVRETDTRYTTSEVFLGHVTWRTTFPVHWLPLG